MEGGAAIGGGALSALIQSANDTLWMIPQGFISNWISNKQFDYRLGQTLGAQTGFWQMQNKYNSPSAQMQRLSEAGLNPNLVYGQSSPAAVAAGGSVSAPGTNPSPNYGTADIAGAALAMAQIRQSAAAEANLRADARLKNAEAYKSEVLGGFYPELVQIQVDQASKNLEKTAADIDLTKSSAAYTRAQEQLAIAQTAYQNGEIDLQQFRKQNMIAQTQLYISQSALNKAAKGLVESQTLNMNIQNGIDALALKYQEYFMKDDGTMKEMSGKEREAKMRLLEHDAAAAAAAMSIDGSKAAQWTKFVIGNLGQVAGAAASLGLGYGGLGAGMKAFGSMTPYQPNSYFGRQ